MMKKKFILALMIVGFLVSTSSVGVCGMIGKWGDEWKTTKKEFKDLTGKKKPNKKILGIFRSSAGIDKALKKVDATFAKRDAKGFEKALKSFSKKKNKYLKRLSKTIAKQKNADSAYSKGLKLLKKDLKAIEATALAQLEVLSSAGSGGDRHDKTYKMALKFLRGGIAKAKKFIAKVKSKPDAETWNAGIKDAGRDITQFLGNIVKYIEKGDDRWKGGNPKSLFSALDPYANSKVKFEKGEEAKTIEKELKKFEGYVKQVNKWAKKQG